MVDMGIIQSRGLFMTLEYIKEIWYVHALLHLLRSTLGEKATINQVTTMLSTSKNVLF